MTCLGLHAHMFASILHTPFVLRPTCLDVHSHARMLVSLLICALCHLAYVCALYDMFVCLDLGYVCHAMCYYSPFVALSFFLVFFA